MRSRWKKQRSTAGVGALVLGWFTPVFAVAAANGLTVRAHEFNLHIQSQTHSYLQLPAAVLQGLPCTAQTAHLRISPHNAAKIHNTLRTAKSAGRAVSVRLSQPVAEACRVEAVYYLEMIQ